MAAATATASDAAMVARAAATGGVGEVAGAAARRHRRCCCCRPPPPLLLLAAAAAASTAAARRRRPPPPPAAAAAPAAQHKKGRPLAAHHVMVRAARPSSRRVLPAAEKCELLCCEPLRCERRRNFLRPLARGGAERERLAALRQRQAVGAHLVRSLHREPVRRLLAAAPRRLVADRDDLVPRDLLQRPPPPPRACATTALTTRAAAARAAAAARPSPSPPTARTAPCPAATSAPAPTASGRRLPHLHVLLPDPRAQPLLHLPRGEHAARRARERRERADATGGERVGVASGAWRAACGERPGAP